jgi:eukaryotic-like serine/threonine-protein kinase
MINLIGNTIEHYQILVKIRETPTRVLYKAYNAKSHTTIALEVLKTNWLRPDELLELINEQVRKNTELTHPNIAPVADTGLHDGLIYIVYNFSPAHPLRRFFHRTYPWKEMARELVSIAHALAYAHEKEIIHGSLHPSSIVIDEKRNPILFDFGFEQIITDYILAHAPGAWINRWGFEYRAPAQLNGVAPDKQSDIYALGIMLYEWLIGKIPQLDGTILGTIQMRKTPPVISKEAASVPPFVQNLIQKCIALDPAERYESMQEVYIVLARGALDMSITKKMVRKPLAIPAQRFTLKRLHLGLISLAALLAVFVIFVNRSTLSSALSTASVTPTLTRSPTTPTGTSAPTNTPIPTQTEIPATPTLIAFPVFQGIPISSAINQTLVPDNVNKMVMLSVWGIGNVNGLASAPAGNYVAAASSVGLFIFDAHNLQVEKYIDTRSSITAIEFSPDSKLIATGDRNGLIQMWSTENWAELEVPYSGHIQAILDLAFSPDGSRLASVDSSSVLIQWQVNSAEGPKPARIEVLGGATSLAYSDDGAHIVTGGNDLLINVWDAATLRLQQKKDFSSKVVDIATVKGSDNLFVIGGNDQRVALLDLSSETSLTTVGYLRHPLTSVAASPDGTLIAAGDLNGGIATWDISGEKFKEVLTPKNYVLGNANDLESPGSLHSLAFSFNGTLIFSGVQNGNIRSVNATTGADDQQNLRLNAHVKRMAISHNSQYLITQQGNDSLTMWDLWSGVSLYQLQGEIKAGDPFSQNDESFVVASVGLSPATVNIYDPSSGTEIRTLNSQRGIKAIQFINDNTQLITVYSQFIELWSLSSWQKLENNPEYDGTGCLAIKDINDQPVVSITKYQFVIVNNDNKSGLCVFAPLDWTTAFNEARGMIVYGGESILAIANARNPKEKDQNLHGVNHKNIVSVAISPNGDLIAAAYDDHTIHIWDAVTRDELTSIEDGLYGHNNSVTDLQFTPDGKLLISTSLDGTIRLWGIPY